MSRLPDPRPPGSARPPKGDEPTTIGRSPSSFEAPAMTSAEFSRFFAQRLAAFNTLDAAVLAADYTSDCVLESPTAGVIHGRSGVERVYRAWFDAFLDLRVRSTQIV